MCIWRVTKGPPLRSLALCVNAEEAADIAAKNLEGPSCKAFWETEGAMIQNHHSRLAAYPGPCAGNGARVLFGGWKNDSCPSPWTPPGLVFPTSCSASSDPAEEWYIWTKKVPTGDPASS